MWSIVSNMTTNRQSHTAFISELGCKYMHLYFVYFSSTKYLYVYLYLSYLCLEFISLVKYRMAQKLLGSLELLITFNRKTLESCGFHRSKEHVLLHIFMYYSAIQNSNKKYASHSLL